VRGVVVWLVGAICSLGLLLVVRAGILPPESTYANDQLPAIIIGTSFSAVILGFQSMKLITFGRDLKLQRPTFIELVSQVANLAAVILVGWVSESIWAFVFGSLFGALVSTLLSHLWLPGPRDRFAWDREALKELARFGKWVFFSSVISSLAINGDRLLLAGWLNPAEVGYYSIAANLVAVPDAIATKVFGGVVLPALSDVLRRQPARLGELYARMRLVTDSCLIGLSGFLFSTSPWLIGLLYDARYEPSGIILQYLSISLIFARYNIFQSLFLALGHPNYLVVLNCFRTVSLFILVPAAYYLFGPTGAIVGVAIHMLPSVIATLWLSTRVGASNPILEIALLGIWPLGWAIGYGFVAVARQIGI
jgi:O-antigen/teichoic acid export membrane protein